MLTLETLAAEELKYHDFQSHQTTQTGREENWHHFLNL